MKKIALITLLLCGCATPSGSKLSAPVSAALGSIKTNAQSVLKSGSQPQDKRVVEIVKQSDIAQKSVVIMTTKYDKIALSVVKKDHRIFVDDCIFGAVALAILVPILLKVLPLLAL